MKNKFLIKFKNIIPIKKNKDNNLITTLSFLKSNKLITPITSLINTCEFLSPGIKILPYVKSGRVHFIPGKIKYLASMYKGLTWILEAIKQPSSTKLTKRISIELENIEKGSGESINQKRLFIKELKIAKLNYRRKRVWLKFINRKTFRRIRKRKQKKLKKLYKKLRIKKVFFKKPWKRWWKPRKKFTYKNKKYFIKKKKKKKMKFWKKSLKKKGFLKKRTIIRKRKFKKFKDIIKQRMRKKIKKIKKLKIIWKRVIRKEKYIHL